MDVFPNSLHELSGSSTSRLSDKYPDEAKQLFKDMIRNESHCTPRARAPRVTGIHEVGTTIPLEATVDALSRKFDLIMSKKANCKGSHVR